MSFLPTQYTEVDAIVFVVRSDLLIEIKIKGKLKENQQPHLFWKTVTLVIDSTQYRQFL